MNDPRFALGRPRWTRPSALIRAHELPFRQDVPLRGGEQVLPRGAFFEVERGIQRVDAEEVAVRFALRRRRTAVADLAEVVLALAGAAGQGRLGRDASASSPGPGGMLYSTQWTHRPRGASGSSQSSARLFVLSGAPLHFNGGETSLPSAVYCLGMVSPSWIAELVRRMVMVGMVEAPC